MTDGDEERSTLARQQQAALRDKSFFPPYLPPSFRLLPAAPAGPPSHGNFMSRFSLNFSTLTRWSQKIFEFSFQCNHGSPISRIIAMGTCIKTMQ